MVCRAPSGRAEPSGAPAPRGRLVVAAGRFTTVQCQKPPWRGASGSKQVTTKLPGDAGKPAQASCGEVAPPAAVNRAAMVWPSATSSLVTANDGTGGSWA